MVQAQSDLIKQFNAGYSPEDIQDASNMKVERTDEPGYDAVVVGYDHAVYAARRNNGTIVIFNGWKGRSVSTTQHIGTLKYTIDNPNIANDGRPGRGGFAKYDEGQRAVV